jgi:hypothetical protein
LNYELDTYLDALQGFPENADMLQVARGNATLIKKDIFKNLMWYVLPQSNKQYPLTIERVRKIKGLNMQGTIPEELEAVEVVSTKAKEVEPEFVDVVGHISLRSLEKADKKRRDKSRDQRQQQQKGPNRQLPPGGVQPSKPGMALQKKGDAPQQAPQKPQRPQVAVVDRTASARRWQWPAKTTGRWSKQDTEYAAAWRWRPATATTTRRWTKATGSKATAARRTKTVARRQSQAY